MTQTSSKLQAFRKRFEAMLMPSAEWTAADRRHLWTIPFSEWGDYFALRHAKKKYEKMVKNGKVARRMPSLAPLYIQAIEKGRVKTADYLQSVGDIILRTYVQKRFSKKHGVDSVQWEDFMAREEIMFDKIVELRKQREYDFLRKEARQYFDDKFPLHKMTALHYYIENALENEDKVAEALNRKNAAPPVQNENTPHSAGDVSAERLQALMKNKKER